MQTFKIEVRRVGKVGRGNSGSTFKFRATRHAATGNRALSDYMGRNVGKAKTVRSLDGRKEFRAVSA